MNEEIKISIVLSYTAWFNLGKHKLLMMFGTVDIMVISHQILQSSWCEPEEADTVSRLLIRFTARVRYTAVGTTASETESDKRI